MKTRKNFHQIRVFPNDQSIEQAFGLLMDILKRPILGHYVHEIQHYWRPQCEVKYEMEERKQNLRDLGGNEFHLLESAIQRAGFTGPKESLVLNMIRSEAQVVAGIAPHGVDIGQKILEGCETFSLFIV